MQFIKNCCSPLVSKYEPGVIPLRLARRYSLPVARVGLSLPESHVRGGVEVYTWIVLALSISLDFWLLWLVHEA